MHAAEPEIQCRPPLSPTSIHLRTTSDDRTASPEEIWLRARLRL
jgi:hypothetical protein